MDGETEGSAGRVAATKHFKEVGLKVLTLNCWGVPVPVFGSRDIDDRFQLIGAHFAQSDYDILLFQEVWLDKQFNALVNHLKVAFPHYYYFYRYPAVWDGVLEGNCCNPANIPVLACGWMMSVSV